MIGRGDVAEHHNSRVPPLQAPFIRAKSVSDVARFTLLAAAIGIGISYSKVYLFHLSAVVLVGFLIVRRGRRALPYGSRLESMFIFMLFWSIVSLAWSWDPAFGINYCVYLASGLVIVFASLYASNGVEYQEKTFKSLSIVFLVELAISLLEALGVFRFPVSSMSPYASYFGRLSYSDVGIGMSIASYLRHMPTGFEWNPNNLALLVVMILPFFIFRKSRVVSLGGVLLCMILIIMSGSRGVWIGSTVVLACSYFIKFEKKRILYVMLLAVCIVAVTILFALFADDQHPKIRDVASSISILATYVFGSSSGLDLSILLRREWIDLGIQAFIETWGFGIGSGGHNWLLAGASMHNYWIEILTNGGVIVFVPYVVWFLSVIVSLLRVRRRAFDQRIRYYATACAMSMLGFAIACVSASTVIYFFPKWILYGFSIATIYNSRPVLNSHLIPSTSMLRARRSQSTLANLS